MVSPSLAQSIFFTDDGKIPCHPDLVGPYTTSQKAKEYNLQVMNHVLFWAHTLADRKSCIDMTLFGEPLIVVEKEPLTTISPFSIPLDPATYEEPAPDPQMSLFGWSDSEEDIDDD